MCGTVCVEVAVRARLGGAGVIGVGSGVGSTRTCEAVLFCLLMGGRLAMAGSSMPGGARSASLIRSRSTRSDSTDEWRPRKADPRPRGEARRETSLVSMLLRLEPGALVVGTTRDAMPSMARASAVFADTAAAGMAAGVDACSGEEVGAAASGGRTRAPGYLTLECDSDLVRCRAFRRCSSSRAMRDAAAGKI